MVRARTVVVITVLIAASVLGWWFGDERRAVDQEYRVVQVFDGDTIVVRRAGGGDETIRLLGVDTPETHHPRKPVQCYGPEASKKAKEMLTGIFVHIETDPTQDTYDKYHRLLAYVFLPDGTSFNEYMVRNGYAREYTYDKPYHYQAQFKDDQKKAQQEKIGLWQACAF